MTTTLIPAEDQTQLMLESPMSTSEKLQKKQLEATASGAARTRANCLLEIYQDKLFRGDHGGRCFGDYLTAPDGAIQLGYSDFNTDKATYEMMWALLCNGIEEWNEANELRDPLPLPASRNYMHGWQLLFDRARSKGAHGYAPFSGIGSALKTWKTLVFKHGDKPTLAMCRAEARTAKELGEAREAINPGIANLKSSQVNHLERSESTPEPEYTGRTLTAEERMAAAAARAERQEREASQQVYNASLKEDGIDPRLISTMEKSDFDVMAEAETYCNCMGRLAAEAQQLDVWVRGRINQYGTDGLDFLRQCDVGIYNVSDDIERITQVHSRLTSLIELLTDNIDPGDLDSGNFQSEPQK